MKKYDYSKEQELFHDISPKILQFIKTASRKIAVQKPNSFSKVEYATVADIEVEKIIVKEINKHFPADKIVAEETSPKIPENYEGRYWLIDPICGTTNFSRGANLFATNIALAENGHLIAACVIDHNEKKYIWSIKDNKIFMDNKVIPSFQPEQPSIIDFEFSTVSAMNTKEKEKHLNLVRKILQETQYYISSYATSLAFTYTALGKIDAYIVPNARVWDIAAPNFLVLQAGGKISDINGKEWTLHSNNVIGARDKNLHKEIINFLNDPIRN